MGPSQPFRPPTHGMQFVGVDMEHVRGLSFLFLCSTYVAENPDVYEEMIQWLRLNGGDAPPNVGTEEAVEMLKHITNQWRIIQDFMKSQLF